MAYPSTASPIISTSSDGLFEEPRKYPEYIRYAALIIGIPVMNTSIIGNLLTVVAVLKTKKLRTGTNIFIISLSTFDLMYSCIIMPTVLTIHWNNAWVFSKSYCHIYPIVFFMVVGEGLMSLVGTAVTRYLKILHPKIFNFVFGKKAYVGVLMCAIWSAPVLVLLPPMLGVWGTLGFEPKTLTCTFIRDGSNYNSFLLVSAFIIPISLIAFAYLCILCKVCSNHRKVAAARQQITGGAGASGLSHARQKEQREDLRYTKMMVAIFIVYLMSYAPYMINNLLDPHHQNMGRGFLTASCAWFSTFLNPVLYVLLNRKFKRAFLTILPFNCGRCNPETVEISTTEH